MGRRTLAILSALCVLAAAAGCTSARPTPLDPQPAPAPPAATASPGAAATESPPATGAAEPVGTERGGGDNLPGDPGARDFPTDARAYAIAAVAAWAAGDRVRLDDLEVPAGLLHATPATGGFTLVRCDGGGAGASCLFLNAAGDELTLPVRPGAVGGPQAVGAGGTLRPTTFPTDDRAYAEQALLAWQHRNDARLRLLTRQGLGYATVDGMGARPAAVWTFDHGEGGAGSVYFTWRDDAGHGLTFRFANGPPAPATGDASQHRITEVMYEP